MSSSSSSATSSSWSSSIHATDSKLSSSRPSSISSPSSSSDSKQSSTTGTTVIIRKSNPNSFLSVDGDDPFFVQVSEKIEKFYATLDKLYRERMVSNQSLTPAQMEAKEQKVLADLRVKAQQHKLQHAKFLEKGLAMIDKRVKGIISSYFASFSSSDAPVSSIPRDFAGHTGEFIIFRTTTAQLSLHFYTVEQRNAIRLVEEVPRNVWEDFLQDYMARHKSYRVFMGAEWSDQTDPGIIDDELQLKVDARRRHEFVLEENHYPADFYITPFSSSSSVSSTTTNQSH
jgi:hypothetical protein